jgi:tyrosinase
VAFTRQNVWTLGGDWADPILWYARGVAAMQARPIATTTSWRFYGGIHGFEADLWQQIGYLSASDQLPSSADQTTFWGPQQDGQCQHGSWYFLPWHRGYLLAFEANVRAAIATLGGPADWALPYWNYFGPGQSALPPAFASEDWPDGKGNNPLFVTQRYGPNNDGNVYIPLNQVNLKALGDPVFTDGGGGGSQGFGGIDTGFNHNGQQFYGIESQPHNNVHVLVGGPSSQQPGLMSDPVTAGLDPIFWLHHANIDRLWEVWRENPPAHVNPTDTIWLNGPSDGTFAMPMPGGTTWNYTAKDVVDLAALGYTYDDLSAVPVSTPRRRAQRLGATAAMLEAMPGGPAVETPKNVELIGASQQPLGVQGTEARTSVQLDPTGIHKVARSLTLTAAAAPAPDRVFLNLENVRSTAPGAFDVYVGLPDGAAPADHPELLAGTVGLFGVRKASLPDGEHGGEGQTYVLDISDIADTLHLNNALDVAAIPVRIVPVAAVPAEAKLTIGRVAIYRQGT